MKTKYWIMLLAGVLAVCLAVSIFLLRPQQAASAQILSEGKVIATVSLLHDQEFVVESSNGSNTVIVRDGKIAVTAATCPDHHCIQRGFCTGGMDIVCLPNKLVIRFLGEQTVDGAVG